MHPSRLVAPSQRLRTHQIIRSWMIVTILGIRQPVVRLPMAFQLQAALEATLRTPMVVKAVALASARQSFAVVAPAKTAKTAIAAGTSGTAAVLSLQTHSPVCCLVLNAGHVVTSEARDCYKPRQICSPLVHRHNASVHREQYQLICVHLTSALLLT